MPILVFQLDCVMSMGKIGISEIIVRVTLHDLQPHLHGENGTGWVDSFVNPGIELVAYTVSLIPLNLRKYS